MKKLGLVLIALIAILGLVGCPGTTDGDNDNPFVDTLGEWTVKGSWDWETPSAFEKDPVDANKGSVTVKGFAKDTYQFMVVNGEDQYWITSENTGITDPITFDTKTDKGMGNNTNAKFLAEKVSYDFNIDISGEWPVVTVKATEGAEASHGVLFATAVEKLEFNAWNGVIIEDIENNKIVNSENYTVTFKVVVSAPSANFGFKSANGYLKGAGETTKDTAAKMLYDSGDACVITTADAVAVGAKYDVVVTLPIVEGEVDSTDFYTVKSTKTQDGTLYELTVADVKSRFAIRGAKDYFKELTENFGGEYGPAASTISANVISIPVTGSDATEGGFAFVFADKWYKYAEEGGLALDTEVELGTDGMSNTILVGMIKDHKYIIKITVPVKAADATKYDTAGKFKIKVIEAPAE